MLYFLGRTSLTHTAAIIGARLNTRGLKKLFISLTVGLYSSIIVLSNCLSFFEDGTIGKVNNFIIEKRFYDLAMV